MIDDAKLRVGVKLSTASTAATIRTPLAAIYVLLERERKIVKEK
jgi:hypothetical protein